MVQAIIEFAETWNEHFAHPFTWTYRGDGLHGKAVRRFLRLLQMESAQMEIGFLTKQLLLMANMAKNYWAQVDAQNWQQLLDLMIKKQNYPSSIIVRGDKEKQRVAADQAMVNLSTTLHDNLVADRLCARLA